MAEQESLTLKIAGKKDFAILNRILILLVVIAAALSPEPVKLTIFVIFLTGPGWVSGGLFLQKRNEEGLTLDMFADGRVRLNSSDGNIVEGVLSGQQWCTHQVAVLRLADQDVSRQLVILSAQQQGRGTSDFRRLRMWLKLGFAAPQDKGRTRSPI